MAGPPIFVVGVQRSGTTLLAAMLAAHSRLSCGPETHFFRHLAETAVAHLVDPGTWPEPGMAFVGAISHTPVAPGPRKSLLDKYHLDAAAIRSFLQARNPSVPALLASVTEQYMSARGKVRWVEKTPDHLLHLALIRRHFPDSPIVRIVRDPRDVAVSLMKVPWGARTLLEGVLYWQRLQVASQAFFVSDRNCHTLRFEDLVSDPTTELQRICTFLGEPFEAQMLDTSSTGEEINARNAPWKKKVSQAADASRAAAWKTALTPQENAVAEAVVGDLLVQLGYPVVNTFHRRARIFPREQVGHHQTTVEALACEGIRFWTDAVERPDVLVYFGDPAAAQWLGEGFTGRLRGTSRLIGDVLRARRAGMEIRWHPGGTASRSAGWCDVAVRQLLSRYCHRDEERVGPEPAQRTMEEAADGRQGR